ncbi:transient receptor potential cation channel subfamily A member 1-like [Montipora capricornis]|uniref:transient receptor potential cation channel subfamily A member 1-like n=1 Tax=Montipora capricornis TaxID=246305 RepID=UPI0035F171DC
MDSNRNGLMRPVSTGSEEIPLMSVGPTLHRKKRAQDLSLLSLQSDGSHDFVAPVGAGDDVTDAESADNPDKLHLACWYGDEDEVKKILSDEKQKADVDALDSSGRTPLHNAILGRHVKIIQLLLESGADTSLLDRSQDAPLHSAVRSGDEKLIEALLSGGKCDLHITAKRSQTALHIAAELDNASICKILIKAGAQQDCYDDEKMTPLTRAVEKGACNVAMFFLADAKHKKKDMMKDVLNDVDSDGSTLLHLAVDSGSSEMVQLCLHYGAIIRQPKENDKITAFHMACGAGALQIVKLFASKDHEICRVTLVCAQGWTPLHLAAMNNHADVVKYLLEKGASVDPRDKQRRTPLFLAAERGGTEAVKILISSGANVRAKDVDLRSCVRVAVGNAATMEVLLQRRAAIPLITDKDITGFAPVHYAAKHGNLENILLFMKWNKATTAVTSDSLDTALHGAAKYGWLDIVDALLSGRNIRSINVKNSQGKTALHFACAEGHDRVVEQLLKLGATAGSDHNNRTALHVAAMRGSKRCVECILKHHPQSINLLDKNQNTALHLAAIGGHPDVVTRLLSSDKQEILMNKKNQNVLDAAMEAEQKKVLLAIVSHKRWREVLMSSAQGHFAQMNAFVLKYPEVAERCMDQCVSKEGNPDNEDYKVTYDFSLIQGAPKPGQDYLMVLKTMLQNRRINCLTHPVCFIIMNTKWKTFGWVTLAFNLLLYLFFVIPLTSLAIYLRAYEKRLCGINETLTRKEYIDMEVPCRRFDSVAQGLQVWVAIITFIHLIKELFQVKVKKVRYFLELTNTLEWIGYISALIYVLPNCDCKLGMKQETGAIALFFGWMNLILFLRRLSAYGQYVIMLTTMFVTLLKVLLLFFLFVVGFGSTFYLLMDDESEQYASFPYSMMTIFVMTLGEMNYADVFMPWAKLEYSILSNTLFVMFVLGMPIIIMNMLVGLAVGDIDKIQENAVLDRYVMQVELVLDMEETIPGWFRQRAHIAKHVEYPNKTSKLYEMLIGFSRPGEDKDDEETYLDLPPAFHPLMEKVAEQEKRINGIYDLLKEQSSLIKSMDPIKKNREETSGYREF